jgi:DNA repair exonuclease SbcCD ATPase subunit
MRLDELSTTGFGRLTNATFRFQPGLNFIVGRNEAGKSTLLQAIFALLYGFFEGGSVTTSRKELLNAYHPWDETVAYHGSLTFTLHQGQRYSVERIFGPSMKTSLQVLPHKRDISSSYKSESFGRLYFAEDIFGMSRTVFENTCCIRQSELTNLGKSASSITEAITRLTTSGSADSSTANAIEMLNQVMRDEIGTSRAWTKPLAIAQKKLNDLGNAWERERQHQDRLWSLLREINQYEERLAYLYEQKERHTYLVNLAEQMERRHSLEQLELARQNAALRRVTVSEMAVYQDVAVHLRDEILRYANDRSRLSKAISQQVNQESALRRQLVDIQERIDRLEENLDTTSIDIKIQADTRDRILYLQREWVHKCNIQEKAEQSLYRLDETMRALTYQLQSGRTSIPNTQVTSLADLAKLRSSYEEARKALDGAEKKYRTVWEEWQKIGITEETFQTYAKLFNDARAGGTPPPPRRGCNPFRSSSSQVEQPAELAIYQDIAPYHLELENAMSHLQEIRMHYLHVEQNTRRALGVNPNVEIHDDLFRNHGDVIETIRDLEIQLQLRAKSRDDVLTQVVESRKTTDSALELLRRTLLQAGIEADDPSVGVQIYLNTYEQYVHQVKASDEVNQLRQQYEVIQLQLSQIEQIHAEYTEAEQGLYNLLSKAGIMQASLMSMEQGLQEFYALCTKHQEWLSAKHEWEITEQQLEILEKTNAEQGTIHQIEVTERQLRQLLQKHPDWMHLSPEQSLGNYGGQLRNIDQEIDSVRNEIIRLRQQSESLETQSLSLAELAEQQAAVAKEIEQLQRASGRISTAIKLLQEAKSAYQREFAPRLETRVAHGLDYVTNGRYQRVRIDPADLTVDLWSPETKNWVSSEYLSTGTRDLIYIVMRTAIADLLGNGKEPLPLLFDDPFVHLDANREHQALMYLSEVARDNQILFFSKDLTLPERLRNLLNLNEHTTIVLD